MNAPISIQRRELLLVEIHDILLPPTPLSCVPRGLSVGVVGLALLFLLVVVVRLGHHPLALELRLNLSLNSAQKILLFLRQLGLPVSFQLLLLGLELFDLGV